MKPWLRAMVMGVVVLFAAVAGWRIFGQMQAERHASTAPERALQWRPNDPQALLAIAERQLKAGELTQAAATAKQLLSHEPLQGRAIALLAEVAAKQGRKDDALRMFQIAERRAPRDATTSLWLAQYYTGQGDYDAAMLRLDRLLRFSPRRSAAVYPALMQLAQDEAFAKALARTLQSKPPWRAGFLARMQHPKTGNAVASGRVMQALYESDNLEPKEYARWLDSLMTQGRWGEAYARWSGDAAKVNGRLPFVYNGDFSLPVSDAGFDWRLRRVPGVILKFETATGANGPAAYFRFLDRRAASGGLEQPLFLPPGQYRLNFRARAQALRAEIGVRWVVACDGGAGVIGRSDPIEGNVPWREFNATFTVPEARCSGQRLQLLNAVATGAAQRIAGDLWIDDVGIERVGSPAST